MRVLSDLNIYTLARELKFRIDFESKDLDSIIKIYSERLSLNESLLFDYKLSKCSKCGQEKSHKEFSRHDNICDECALISDARISLITVLKREAFKLTGDSDSAKKIAEQTISNDHVLLKHMILKAGKMMTKIKHDIKNEARISGDLKARRREFTLKTGIKEGCVLVLKSGKHLKVKSIGESGEICSIDAFEYKKNGELHKRKSVVSAEDISHVIVPFYNN